MEFGGSQSWGVGPDQKSVNPLCFTSWQPTRSCWKFPWVLPGPGWHMSELPESDSQIWLRKGCPVGQPLQLLEITVGSWAFLVVVSPGWGKERGSSGWCPFLNTVSDLWALSPEFFFRFSVSEKANTSWLWYNRNSFPDPACECHISHLSLEHSPHLPGLYLTPIWFPDLKKSPHSQSQLYPYSHIQLLMENRFHLPWEVLQQPQKLCLKNQWQDRCKSDGPRL